ncbi:MAG: branched-chain amino acid ABC transporter permease [Nitrospinota bacterium]
MLFAQAVVNGLLLGGIYAAYSVGFSLIFGVMGVINVAHGELVMLGAFITYWVFTLLGIDPFLSIPICIIALFALGFLLQKHVINRVVDAPPLMSLILTFGISLILMNSALVAWTADFRMVTTSYSGNNFSVGSVVVPIARLITFFLSLAVVGVLSLFLAKTELGRAIRATAQDAQVARLMGIDIRRVYAITFGIGAALTGLAGSLITSFFAIYPYMGGTYTLYAFVVVVLGGMGYIPGALWGGLALGIIQSISGAYMSAGMSFVITFVLLYLMLVLRPAGLVGRGIVE